MFYLKFNLTYLHLTRYNSLFPIDLRHQNYSYLYSPLNLTFISCDNFVDFGFFDDLM